MPYCTLNEAWGNDFQNNENNTHADSGNKSRNNISDKEEKANNILKSYNLDDYNKFGNYNIGDNYSRNYNTLREHNGENIRLPSDKKYLINDKLNKNKNIEDFSNKNNYIQYILNENNKLHKIIEDFETINYNDNIFDLIVFISSGIFIIFLLEILSKGFRRI